MNQKPKLLFRILEWIYGTGKAKRSTVTCAYCSREHVGNVSNKKNKKGINYCRKHFRKAFHTILLTK